MSRSDIKYVFLDFDGTIMCYDDPPGNFHPSAIKVINQLADSGITWCTNSGRDKINQLEIIERSRGKGLVHMPAALVCSESLVYCRRNGGYDGLQPWNDDARDLMVEFHTQLQKRVRPHLPVWTATYKPEMTILEDRATVFCVRDEGDLPARFHEELEQIVREVPGGMVTRNGGWVVAMPDQLGKGRALTAFLKVQGADRRHALAIGDHLNDMDMLNGRSAMHMGCAANAGSAVKHLVQTVGGYIAQQEGPLGTIEVLGHYFRREFVIRDSVG